MKNEKGRMKNEQGERRLSAEDPRARPDIPQRTFESALRILKSARALPHDVVGQILARQVGRSGTSIGSNVEEAQGAHTKKEFAQKMNIVRKEALETRYWLRLIGASETIPGERLADLRRESDELVRILSAIVKNARGDKGKGSGTPGMGPVELFIVHFSFCILNCHG